MKLKNPWSGEAFKSKALLFILAVLLRALFPVINYRELVNKLVVLTKNVWTRGAFANLSAASFNGYVKQC